MWRLNGEARPKASRALLLGGAAGLGLLSILAILVEGGRAERPPPRPGVRAHSSDAHAADAGTKEALQVARSFFDLAAIEVAENGRMRVLSRLMKFGPKMRPVLVRAFLHDTCIRDRCDCGQTIEKGH